MTKLSIKRSNTFKRQFKKVQRRGRVLNELRSVLEALVDGKELDPKYHDHKLQNSKLYKQCRECHIQPDLLLIYRIIRTESTLYLVAIGSHADLFV